MDKSTLQSLSVMLDADQTVSPVKTIDGKPVEAPLFSRDADTVTTPKEAFRIQGFNAPEVAHNKGGIFIPGERFNDRSEYDINDIARIGGFTDLRRNGKDVYGRTLAEQVNPETEGKLGDMLVQSGYMKPNRNSSNESVGEARLTGAAQRLFGSNDPILRRVSEAEKARAEQGLSPIYRPKLFVQHTKDYAAFQKGLGVGAAAEESAEVDRLRGILETEDLLPETRANLEAKLKTAQENVWTASTTLNVVGGVLSQPSNRNIMNVANNQFTESLYGGLLEMQKMFFGAGELVGDVTGWEGLSKMAKDKVAAVAFQSGDLASTLSSYKDIGTQDTWTTISDTATYLGNLAGGTIPLMAGLVATLPLGAVGGISAASLMYAGGYYAEQAEDKKNPTMAVALGIPSAILDRLGLEALILGNSMFTLAGRKEVTDALIQKAASEGRELTQAAAKELLEKHTKQEILALAKDTSTFAARQYASREAMARGLLSIGGKGLAEGGTEVAQTAMELVAMTGDWSTDVQYERDFHENLMNAAIGGGALGGIIGGLGNFKEAAQWHAVANRDVAFSGQMNPHATFSAAITPRYFMADNPNTIQVAAQASSVEMRPPRSETNKEWFSDLKDFPMVNGAWNSAKAIFSSPGRLLREHGRQAIRPEMLHDANGNPNENLGVLQAIMGGYGNLPGDHYSAAKQRQMGKWAGYTSEELASNIGVGVEKANQMVRSAFVNYWSKGLNLPQDSKQNEKLQQWKEGLDDLRKTIATDLADAGLSYSEVADTNGLFTASNVNPGILAQNRVLVEQILQDAGASKQDSTDTVDGLLARDPEAVQAARDFAAEKGLFTDPRAEPIFENNIFTTIENLKDSLSTRLVTKKYLGKDGKTLANLLNKAYQAGELDADQLKLVAKEVKDWYDIVTHNYHSLEKTPRLEKVLSWGVTMTMLAFLGKAALSSQVEVATSTLGTPGHLIKEQLGAYFKNLKKEIGSDINKFNSATMSRLGVSYARNIATNQTYNELIALQEEQAAMPADASDEKYNAIEAKIQKLYKEQAGHKLFERLGYSETGFNTQTKFEYADSNQQKAMHIFATAIGLRAQTDAMRLASLSISADIAIGKLMNLAAIPKADRQIAFALGDGMNNGQLQDYNDLNSWGMNVEYTLNELELNGKRIFEVDGIREMDRNVSPFQQHVLSTLANMVDSKVMNPQAHNIPKYYHDPRLRLLTAMQRFMGTAQAVILPKLYLDYIKDGNAGMRYQAFSVIASALMVAFLANMLKDQLSYGEDSPYVEGVWKNLQRALYMSGMTGQFERVIDAVDPLYSRRMTNPTNNPFKAMWDVTKGVSPIAAWVDRPVKAVLAGIEGDAEQAVRQTARAAPLLGSFPIAADNLSKPFKE